MNVSNGVPVCPRPYRAGERRLAATEATRSKITEAARELLLDPRASTFSIDAIAERANVARMTIYYQFKSKGKLLEALFDEVGERANMREMQHVFSERDPRASLHKLVEIFVHLWETEGALLRRIAAMAALDADVDRALTERGSWRRDAIAEIVGRIPNRPHAGEIVDVLHALTSLETYDTIALRHPRRTQVVTILQRSADAILANY